jgi:hypothetical protein
MCCGAGTSDLITSKVTQQQVAQMLGDFADELREAGGRATEIAEQVRRQLPALQEIAGGVFGQWASLL